MAKADVSLRGITWDHIRGYGPLEASVSLYKEETDIQVHWAKRNLKDFGDASLDRLAREYDLIIMDHPHSGMASVTRCIVPMDEILDSKILEEASANSVGPSFNSYKYDNHVWALPIDAACQVSCCRKDLLGELPLPQTWNDVFQLADHLKSKGQFIGMALCPTDCNCSFLTLCAQLGDPIEEHKLTASATGQYALTILKKLYTIAHPDSGTWNPISLYDHMACEDDVPYCPLAFGYTNYARAGYAKKRLLYGENVTEAATYAAWLCSEKFQSTTYVEAGGQPAHKKAWTSEKANSITGHFFSETLPTIEEAYVRPRTLHWPLFQEELGQIIHSGITRNYNVEKTWKEIEICWRSSDKSS